MTKYTNLEKGFYTILYPNGQHRTIQIKQPTTGNFAGRTLVGFMSGTDNTKDYTFFGFLSEDGKLSFWTRFRNSNEPVRLQRIEAALDKINANAPEAGKAFALMSGHCYRCGRLLTNPESIVTGIGSECRKRVGLGKLSDEEISTAALELAGRAPARTYQPKREKIGGVFV